MQHVGAGGKQAVGHAIDLGHARMKLCPCPIGDDLHSDPSSIPSERGPRKSAVKTRQAEQGVRFPGEEVTLGAEGGPDEGAAARHLSSRALHVYLQALLLSCAK